jgi:hypothetical protein
MFNPQLGKALFEILPGEVSSSIAYQDSRSTEGKIMLLILQWTPPWKLYNMAWPLPTWIHNQP